MRKKKNRKRKCTINSTQLVNEEKKAIPVNQQIKNYDTQKKSLHLHWHLEKIPMKYLPLITTIISIITFFFGGSLIPRFKTYIAERNIKTSPQIELYMETLKLSDKDRSEIIFGYPSCDGDSIVLADFPVTIINSSDMTLENLQIHIRYPSIGKLAIENDMLKVSESSAKPGTTFRTYGNNGNFDVVAVYLQDLNPKQSIKFTDQIHLSETVFSDVVVANTLDNVPLEWALNIDYSFDIMITVSAKNIEPYDYHIQLYCLRSRNIEDLFERYQEKIINNMKKKIEKLSLLDYRLLLWINGKKLNTGLLLYPTYEKYTDNDVILYIAEGFEKKLYTYSAIRY